MPIVCYTWADAPYAWKDAPFTWVEACVVLAVGGLSPYRKERLRELKEDEKETLINLFFRMGIDELQIENRSSKTKNKKIKVKLKDVEVLVSEQRLVEIKSVNIIKPINEDKIVLKIKIT
jgi:hypothetical protein